MQRTDCYQTLQGSAKKLVSATGLFGGRGLLPDYTEIKMSDVECTVLG